MWRRSDLLHPATIIASIALFVALGGVTYAAATIGSSQLKSGAVTRAKIKNSAVSPSKLSNRAVTNQKLANNAVTPSKLRTGAVTAGKIGQSAIQTANVANSAVTEAKLGSGAVTAPKLGANAVGSAALADGSVAAGKLADGSVTAGKLADGAITAAKLATGQVVTGRAAITSFRQSLATTETKTLATLPGFGTFTATCTGGQTVSTFTNSSGVALDVHRTTINQGVSPSVDASSVAPAGPPVQTTGAADDQRVVWQLSYVEAGGIVHVAEVTISHVFDGSGCIAFGQSTSTG